MPLLTTGAGGYPAAAGGGGAAYSYLGSFSTTSGNAGTTTTMPFTMTGVGGLLVVFFGCQNSQTVNSVVYDPTGANVTLTQDAFVNSSPTAGLYSGVIPGASGSKNVVVTTAGSVQFLVESGHAWLATNLISNVKQQSTSISGSTATISATAGYFMFGGAFQTTSQAPVTYATSTEVPTVRPDANTRGFGADWTIVSTNAAFSIVPKAVSFAQAWATYH